MHSVSRKTLAALTLAGFMAGAFAQSADPGMGSWKLNVEKSRFSPGPAPQGLVTRFAPSMGGVTWRAERAGADGKPVVSEYTAAYDGKDYPVKGSPTADAVSLRRINATTTERVNKKDGKIVSTETREIAKDGKSYTTVVKGTTSKGEPIDNRMVFDRQ